MDNATIAGNFTLLAKLMDIHGKNSFKTKTYAVAAFNIEKLPDQLKDTPQVEIFKIRGIGESAGMKIVEMLDTGKLAILDEYILNTPPGIIEMLNIKGLGPKKINTIWKEMEIESIGELLYACDENRLTRFKGFGEKTQQNVREAIDFYLQHQGSFLYASVDIIYPEIEKYLQKIFNGKIKLTGAFRRQEIVIDELEFVVEENNNEVKPKFQSAYPPELLEEKDDCILYLLKNGLKIRLYTGRKNLTEQQFITTGTPEFINAFKKSFPGLKLQLKMADDDAVIFDQAGIQYIPPCLREDSEIINKAKKRVLPVLIETPDIKGLIHSHSNWSDGANTIEEMAGDLIKRGFEYLVISDHSKSAFYANGLKEDRLIEQHRYIDELNIKLNPFRIFKSIESDILNDGSLDYDNKVLSSFDLVITSVHSNLKMAQEKAMARLMKAIENPYTTILGHMTGRLLLSRNGYPIDHKKIIDACAANHVVIELNAHPRRLDIDWKYIYYALEKGVLISIDPDAHSLDGFDDVKYGVLAAQKGGLTKENNLSSYSLMEFEKYLAQLKTKKENL